MHQAVKDGTRIGKRLYLSSRHFRGYQVGEMSSDGVPAGRAATWTPGFRLLCAALLGATMHDDFVQAVNSLIGRG
jgi:hypothetical protein